MKSEIVAQGMTAADLDKLDLIADVQFNEPMGSAALNRKFYGIMPAGIYRGFMPVVRGGLKVSVGDSPVNVAAIDVDGFMISVQGRRPVELTVPTGRKVYCIIEANYAIGLRTTQVDVTASMKAADIRMINADELRGNHVIVFSANLPADTTEIRADQLEIGERQEADIGSDAIDRHTKNYLNPHQVNKGQIGLSDVENYGIATLEEAKAGEAEHKYMTPATTAAAITEQAGAAVSSHTNNKNNPHGVTKAQVGLGKVNDYAVASAAEAQAGTATDKYMTPATTSAAITEQAGAAVSSHTSNKNNPHGVTKAQVGLGSVENYGVATTAEAQAGTVANKYMTPATTAAAITQQAGAAVSSHTGNKNNPHAVTKAQVGLGSVNNWPATAAINDASDAKYATAGAVKRAYDLAAAALPKAGGDIIGKVRVNVSGTMGTGSYGIDMMNGAIGGLNQLAFSDPCDASGEGVYFPKTGKTGGSTVGSDYDVFKVLDGVAYINASKFYTESFKPTKTDVGLSNVNNWPATAAINDASDAKYATAGAVKKAYDLANGKAPASHNHAWGNITGAPVYATRWPTAAEAGAAPASHTHSYLPLSGGSFTGQIRGVATGGSYASVYTRNDAPFTSTATHSGSSFAPAINIRYSHQSGYSGVYYIGDLCESAANAGKLTIGHINSSGSANFSTNFNGGNGEWYFPQNGNFNDVHIRSDRRLKTNLVKAENALSKVSKINAYHYDKRLSLETTEYTEKEFGLIAQELEAVLPEAVKTDEQTTLKTISNSAVNALLVEAIKELKSEVEALKAKLSQAGA